MTASANMKTLGALLACLVLITVLPAGCDQPADISPGAGMGDPYPAPLNDPQISILAPDLRQWLAFHPATVVSDGDRPMHVQVPVRNLAEKKYLVDYRFIFYDANGMQMDPIMGWSMVALRPKQTQYLTARALSTDAESYRLEVKWAR